MRKILTILPLLLMAWAGAAQERNFWTATSEAALDKNVFSTRQRPVDFKLFELNEAALLAALGNSPSERSTPAAASSFILGIPNAQGKTERFRIVEASVMEPGLAAKYPNIRSYLGIGLDDPAALLRFAVSPMGFSGTIFSPGRSTTFIEKAGQVYVVAEKSAYTLRQAFECLTEDDPRLLQKAWSSMLKNADDGKLRTMRIAVTTDAEFATQYDGGAATDAERRANVMSKINALMTRCNGIFEKDFGLRVLLISNNDVLIYFDAASDPWNGGNLNDETANAINAHLAEGDYDIGHALLRSAGGGNAGCIGCVCNSNKNRGYTGLGNWDDDASVVDYLPHEIGHQLGGTHTFSHASDNGQSQMEPGSGTTIMSYAGITGPATDVANHSHDNFHAISIQQITDNLKSKSCPVVSNSGNNVPSANAGADYTIPHSTPFQLTGSGSDADGGDVLNFVWEQFDKATVFPTVPSTTATTGPAFRCFPPAPGPARVFPSLPSILNGSNTNTWERLPAVGRTLTFRFTVRDNHPGAGANRSDDMVVTVHGSAGPFQVTTPNTNVTWCPGPQTITWDVANTTAAPINTSHVNILLSTDGGNSFPIVLASGTANDGSESVNIPCTFSTTARIKVEAVGNIYFDISNANFTVGDQTPPTFTVPADITINKDASCNYDASVLVTGDVTDVADNCDNNLDATFTDVVSNGKCVGETIITRTWQLADDCGNVTSKVQTITITDVTPPSFTVPANTTIYADANCNYDASVGVTGDVTDEADNCDPTLDAGFSDVVTNGSCVGEKIITRTWTLTDDCGNSTSQVQTILVKDTTAPLITGVSASPANLWPPNHKLRDVVINYTATDNCSAVTSTLSVTSNEHVNGTGDGNTSPDWIVVNNHLVKLRAERSGNHPGRIYTVTITATDDCGNTSSTTVNVYVAHDQSITRMMPSDGNKEGLQLFTSPNPTRNHFAVWVRSNSKERIQVQVFDIAGRLVESRFVNEGSSFQIGSNYKNGQYYIRLTQGSQQVSAPLIKLAE